MMFVVALTFLAAVNIEPKPKVEVRATEHFDLPAGGTIRLSHSVGELDIVAWDQPGVEVTTIKWKKSDKVSAAVLDRVRVTSERKGGDLVITSEYPKHKFVPGTDFDLEYHIRAPRNAKLVIDHDDGEVNLDGMTGDVHATNRCGDIALHLPDGVYAIDAKSKVGAVTSDFPGDPRSRHWLGEEFDHQNAPPAPNLYLRIGFGDIILLKIRRPEPVAADLRR